MPGKHKIVKARKDHECYYCRRVIPKGSDYVIHEWFGVDRRWGRDKMHPDCEDKYIDWLCRADDHEYLAERANQ